MGYVLFGIMLMLCTIWYYANVLIFFLYFEFTTMPAYDVNEDLV